MLGKKLCMPPRGGLHDNRVPVCLVSTDQKHSPLTKTSTEAAGRGSRVASHTCGGGAGGGTALGLRPLSALRT